MYYHKKNFVFRTGKTSTNQWTVVTKLLFIRGFCTIIPSPSGWHAFCNLEESAVKLESPTLVNIETQSTAIERKLK